MAEFKLGRIKFVWRGPWTSATSYVVDDVVSNGGQSYICVKSHTSNSLFVTDLDANPTYWNLVSAGSAWRDEWTVSTYYNEGDQVKYGGLVYICNTAHTSSSDLSLGLEADQAKWDVFAESFFWREDWTTATRYRVNDFVKYGGVTYVCNTAHTSAATSALGLEADQAKWDVFNSGLIYLGDWTDAVRYRINDIVKYGASTWICTSAHTSTTTFDDTKWSIFIEGLEFENSWSSATNYQIGDTVTYGGYSYIAKENNVNQNPVTSTSVWEVFTTGFNFRGDWSNVSDYRVGDVVRLGGATYLSIADNTNEEPPSVLNWTRLNYGLRWNPSEVTYTNVAVTAVSSVGVDATFDVTRAGSKYVLVQNGLGAGYAPNDTLKILGSSLGGISPANDILITVTNVTGAPGSETLTVTHTGVAVTWASGVKYFEGDLVLFGASTYICVTPHVSGSLTRPDLDTLAEYWNIFSAGAESSILTTAGDTYYFGTNGPTRLPAGKDGQILRVSGNYPSWAYYGVINNLVYVAPTGVDDESEGRGLTVDRPWKTVRFACDQITRGYQNRDAKLLLDKNKLFIMREVSNWVKYTYVFSVTASSSATNAFTTTSTANMTLGMPIEFVGTTFGGVSNNVVYYVKEITSSTTFKISNTQTGLVRTLTTGTGTMTAEFVYDETLCERDTGLLIDALEFDISHGGNGKITEAAKAYYTSAGQSYINANFGTQVVQTIAAYNFLKDLVDTVLSNQDPATNYQTENGILLADQAIQRKDSSVISDEVKNLSASLIDIVIDGLTAGTAAAIPGAVFANTTVSVKTGTYFEILPIIIPNYTAVVGDELRSTVISPQPAIPLLASDKPKTVSALHRISAIVDDLVQNNAITPSEENTISQITTLPAGSVGTVAVSERIISSTNAIYDTLNNGITGAPVEIITDPVGFDSNFLNARTQIFNNYDFIKADVSQYIENNYPSVWTDLGVTGQEKCQRDIGYILDALRYDLTYGGNTQSLIVGRSYYSYIDLVIPQSELTATLAAYTHLKSIIDDIVLNNDVVEQAGNVTPQSRTGLGGNATTATFVQARMDDIIAWITDGVSPALIEPDTSWVSADLVDAYNLMQSKKAEIQSDSIAYVKKFFQELSFDEAICSRDVGYMVDAIGYDVMFNSNFASVIAGKSYYRAVTSAIKVIAEQKHASLGLVNFLKYKVKAIANKGGAALVKSIISDVVDTIHGGATPRILWQEYVDTDQENFAGAKLIWQNKDFISAEVLEFLDVNYPSIVYDRYTCSRDVKLITDALRYDLTYGGNYASKQAGVAYYSRLSSELQIDTNDKVATIAAYNLIKTIAQAIGQGASYTPLQSDVTRITGVTGDTNTATRVGQLIDIITNIIDNGLTNGVPKVTVTTITLNSVLTTSASHGLSIGDEFIPQTTANGLVSGKTYFVKSTPQANEITLTLSYDGSTITDLTNGTGLTIGAEITNLPAVTNVSPTLVDAHKLLSSQKESLQTQIISFISQKYPNLNYNSDTCSRDVGYIIDSLGYDLMLGSNYRSVRSGTSYYQAQASVVLTSQKRATLQSMRLLLDLIIDLLGNGATGTIAVVRKNLKTIIDILDKGTGLSPEVVGTTHYNNDVKIINTAEILRANKEFLQNEATAWIRSSYGGEVSGITGNVLSFATPHNFTVGDPVEFYSPIISTFLTSTSSVDNTITLRDATGVKVNMKVTVTGLPSGSPLSGTTYVKTVDLVNNKITVSDTAGGTELVLTDTTDVLSISIGGTVGGVSPNRVYYVLTTPSETEITVADTVSSTSAVSLIDEDGYMKVLYYFDQAACRRDMGEYVDALIYDLNWPGNYKSTLAALFYNHAVAGSETTDMFWVSNSTGLRNCTLRGLVGDLTELNEFGTRRPTAGAFVALNPGFGPNDKNSWVIARSHYSQNVTMFGTGCSGAKIDSALHNGGNKSMVKNDFTTIISDGIGVWCTGADSLTELVSVFNYYGYAGYLAEKGGRIRATNGNSSYGTYGVIAEGVSSKETPLYGNVNNRDAQAQITNTVTDGVNGILRFEFSNAGTNYTNVNYTVNGSGYNVEPLGDEFRDSAVFESRVIDPNNDTPVGGSEYVTAANAAQEGSATSITISATDQALSSAYVGTRIQITAGTGVGQYANILSYETGSKIAIVVKDSIEPKNIVTTSSDTLFMSLSDSDTDIPASKFYVDMPITFAGPAVDPGGALSSAIQRFATYYVLSITGPETFTFSSTPGGPAVVVGNNIITSGDLKVYALGWDHIVPGTTIASALDLTTTYIIEPRIEFTSPGFGGTGVTGIGTQSSITYGDEKFVVVPTTGTASKYSTDGVTWASAGALSASLSWNTVVYGGGSGATATAIVGGLGGRGAILEAVLGVPNTTGAATADQIASVRIINGGQGYTTPPVIEFVPVSGGTGAVATCQVLEGKIINVTVTIPGSGYLVAPTVNARTDKVTNIIVNTYGRNYFSFPEVTLVGGGASTSATVRPFGTGLNDSTMFNSGVQTILVDEQGEGYTSTPEVVIVDTSARYIAIATGSNVTNTQTSVGIESDSAWTVGGTLPSTNFVSLTYGNGLYVALSSVGGTGGVATSTDSGTTWVSRTTPTLGAGTYSEVAYGNETFVAIATGTNQTIVSSNGTSWATGGNMPSSSTWTSVAYGNGRFVAISSTGEVAYSIDKGVSWKASLAGLPTGTWNKVSYGHGLFVVTLDGSFCAVSPDGISWNIKTVPYSGSMNWDAVAFGNPASNPTWVLTGGGNASVVKTGARALGRVAVASGVVSEIRMVEPGSGYPKGTVVSTAMTTNIIEVDNTINLIDQQPIEFYGLSAGGLVEERTYYVIGSTITSTSFKVSDTQGSTTPVNLETANPIVGMTYRAGPIVEIIDPNNVDNAVLRVRTGDGALSTPSFKDRGLDNATANTDVLGDGYSDLYQVSTFVNVYNLSESPKPGANVEFASLPGAYYKLVTVTNFVFDPDRPGTFKATFQVNPGLSTLAAPRHGDRITTRIEYSQVRLTGHDYLYIGTGNFEDTNYPNVDITRAIQANQELFSGGGRVFFTSTDQDGNFNVGDLFGVQQATGTATLNASAFNLSGLNSLQLGSVELGIGSAVITQFSTDPFFTADSDNIVPTQRAIRAYITAQIGGGQSSLNVNTLTSGIVFVAGNSISTTTGAEIKVTSKMNFTGGIDGAPVALGFFMQK